MSFKSVATFVFLFSSALMASEKQAHQCLKFEPTEFSYLNQTLTSAKNKLIQINNLISPTDKAILARVNKNLKDTVVNNSIISPEEYSSAFEFRQKIYMAIGRKIEAAGLGNIDRDIVRIESTEDLDQPSYRSSTISLNYWNDENNNLQLFGTIQRRIDRRTPEEKAIKGYVNEVGFGDRVAISLNQEGLAVIEYNLSSILQSSKLGINEIAGPPLKDTKFVVKWYLSNLTCE